MNTLDKTQPETDRAVAKSRRCHSERSEESRLRPTTGFLGAKNAPRNDNKGLSIDLATAVETDRAYLLRCWRDGAAWRFSLEPVHEPSPRRGFATLAVLVAFLRAELARVTDNPNRREGK